MLSQFTDIPVKVNITAERHDEHITAEVQLDPHPCKHFQVFATIEGWMPGEPLPKFVNATGTTAILEGLELHQQYTLRILKACPEQEPQYMERRIDTRVRCK